MTINYTTLLSLAEPVTGTESGTWGDDVNKGITDYLDIAIAGTLSLTSASFTAGALTLANTTGSSAGNGITSTTAQYMALKVSSLATNSTITAPSTSKLYLVINADTTYTVTVKASGQTGYTVGVGTRAWVIYNGTDYVLASTNDITKLTGTLPIANGGTGQTTASAAFNALSPITTTGDIIIGNGSNSATRLAIGTNGYVLTSNGTTATWAASTGGVTSFSAGTTGLTPNTGTTGAITLAGTLAVSNGGTGATTLTGVLKGNGTSAFTAATAGTDYVAPGTATTFTALQTFSGSTSVAAMTLANSKEVCTISATAATGTIAYDVTTQSVLYYTSNASANWTVNFRGSSGTSLNTLMNTGESITVAFLVTQGGTAYYNSAVQVDGSSVTPKYQGGTAWSAGNASSIDAYVYTIVKTGSAAFTVFASQTQFK